MARRLVLAFVFLALLAGSGAADPPVRLVVIVHPSRQADVDVAGLNEIFLRRRRFWPDGARIVPLNLPAGTELREAFSRTVLRLSDARLADYWNRQYFSGVLPPATLGSPRAVLRYVATDAAAIGYVPESDVDGSVRVVLRLE